MTELRRQLGHAAGIDVGWIAEDEVVAIGAQRLEEIAAMERNAVAQAMTCHVTTRQGERTGRQIDRVDAGMREDQRRQDGETA